MKSILSIVILSVGIFFIAPHFAHAAIIAKAPNNLGLTSYWPMDEGVGSSVGDFSGSGNSGAFGGTTTPAWIYGKRGKGLSFNGTSKITVGNVTTAASSTISTWIKTTSAAQMPIFSNRGSGLYFGMTGGKFFVYDNSATPTPGMQGIRVINDNNWHHIVWTSDGSTSVMYIDGKVDNTSAQARGADTGTGSIGFDTPNIEYFTGSIDDMRIYNRTLTAAEVSGMYRSGQITRKIVINQGLVGYWSMNEGRGGQAGDSSANGLTGTINNGATWVNGKRGKALSFDGVNQYVSGNLSGMSTTAVSFCTWANKSSNPSTFTQLVGASNGWGALFVNSSGFIFGQITFVSAGNQGTTSVSMPAGWHHYCTTWSNGNPLMLYIDGVLSQSTSNITDTLNSMTAFWIARYSSGTYFPGSIDDARIYNRALSAAEVQTLYRQNETRVNSSQNSRITDGLVGLWSFNGPDYDLSSTTAEILDRSGNNNYGNASGTRVSAGKSGQGLAFNGTDSSVVINQSTSLNTIQSAMTFSTWVKFNQVNRTTDGYDWQALITKNAYGNWFSLMMSTEGGNFLRFYHPGLTPSQSDYDWTGIVEANKWYLVTVSYNGSSVKHYVDGVLKVTTAVTGTPTTNSSNVFLGFSNTGPYPLDGSMDEVRLYNRALSDDEVKQLYNLGR